MDRVSAKWILLSVGVSIAVWFPATLAFVPSHLPTMNLVIPQSTGAGTIAKTGRLSSAYMHRMSRYISSDQSGCDAAPTYSITKMQMVRDAGFAAHERKRRNTCVRMSTSGMDGADGMGAGIGGEGAAVAEAVSDEVDVKKDLLEQIDLVSSSKKRCVFLP